ncbi:Hypothetical predicted protein [Olea europaea subsp. europaea]|uniref:Uncharacterized protein n=1 Tax=Olea europaea subsp. europaea TaxID=158383 RepID=A0A8S0PVZ8_OLEEU|nr:Hypothetical predicted protein [Olea europaea subsp. europaea]
MGMKVYTYWKLWSSVCNIFIINTFGTNETTAMAAELPAAAYNSATPSTFVR